MSKLLNMANEVLEARRRVLLGDWDYITDPTVEFDNACMVIEGYQQLLRRIVRSYQYDQSPMIFFDLMREANACIPEENGHE
jgi:hypothetical protein